MTKISIDLIRKLREKTGAPVIRVKKVLEEVKGNETRAFEILQKEGFEKAAKRQGRETSQGMVEAYTHHSGKIVSVVELLCETDFVARNELFKELAHDLALQVASQNAKGIYKRPDQENRRSCKRGCCKDRRKHSHRTHLSYRIRPARKKLTLLAFAGGEVYG